MIEQCCECEATPAGPAIEWNCIPVPHFGRIDPPGVKVVTISLNPSITEFRTNGHWRPPEVRLPILEDFELASRKDLGPEHVGTCQSKRDAYFGNQLHSFFRPLDDVVGILDPSWSFANGSAAHLDLVACATTHAFGGLAPVVRKELIANCAHHFLASLMALPNRTLLLANGRTVCTSLVQLAHDRGHTIRDLVEEMHEPAGWTSYCGILELDQKRFQLLGWSPFIGRANGLQALAIARWLRLRCSKPMPS